MNDKIVELYPDHNEEVLSSLPKHVKDCIKWLVHISDAIDLPLVIVTVKDKKAAISVSQICFEDSRLEMQGALMDAAMGISNPTEILSEFESEDDEDGEDENA